jgi:hypothetical protein
MEELLKAVMELPDQEKAKIFIHLFRILFLLPENFSGHVDFKMRNGHIVHADGEVSFDTGNFLKLAQQKQREISPTA